jgi:hypothetical protein
VPWLERLPSSQGLRASRQTKAVMHDEAREGMGEHGMGCVTPKKVAQLTVSSWTHEAGRPVPTALSMTVGYLVSGEAGPWAIYDFMGS